MAMMKINPIFQQSLMYSDSSTLEKKNSFQKRKSSNSFSLSVFLRETKAGTVLYEASVIGLFLWFLVVLDKRKR